MRPARMPSRWAKMLPWAYTERRQPARSDDDRRAIRSDLAAQGYVRLADVETEDRRQQAASRFFYCQCPKPDVWVLAYSYGNAYHCGDCGGYVAGMES